MTEFISLYWMEAMWTVLLAIVTYVIRGISKRLTIVFDKNDAMEDGVLSILHDRLQQICTQHLKNECITVEALENLEIMFKSYSRLGGNGTVKKLYERCQNLRIVEDETLED